ncbi:MAG: c-type cytochrome [Alphaproteobacteria bacterium]|nr:c-type cytochrome [Alphaproteobacteria bacterium]
MKRTSALTAAFVAVLTLRPPGALGADLGETLATQGDGEGAAPCVSCHGADGRGNAAAGFPSLAGLDAGYLARQVRLTRDGERASPVMGPVVKTLSDAEIEAVSAWFAGLEAGPPATEAPTDAQAAVATRLVTEGDWPGRDLPPCASCHGPGARGVNASFPALAGQHAAYLEAQLRAWQAGTRATDPGDLMGTVARKLTDDEITAVSRWLAAQPREVK